MQDSSALEGHILRACRRMLEPVVRVALRHGVTASRFAELVKEVFVAVARRDYGLQGRPTNNARVALLTGLSRREVTRLRDVLEGVEPARPTSEPRLSTVLAAWHLDPDFLDASGRPVALAEHGPHPSIDSLLQRHAGDFPRGAVLKELVRLGLVERCVEGFRVLARNYVRDVASPELARQAGQALYDHGQTVCHNLDSSSRHERRFERMASVSMLPRSELQAFRDFVEQEGQAFLESIDAWLSRRELGSEDGASRSSVRAGVGVYAIEDD